MKQRLRFFEFTEMLQATLLRVLSEGRKDAIRITIYGYTKELNHVEFSYEIEFHEEFLRDETFNEITKELLFDDIKTIVQKSEIPIVI